MRFKIRSGISCLLWVCAFTPVLMADTVSTDSGDIEILPILHGSLRLDFDGKIYYVDPYGKGDYSQAPLADVILVTDIHGDHLDPATIATLSKDTTILVVPAAAQGEANVAHEVVMQNGETREIDGVQVEALPMYNLHRGPEPGKLYHDKGRGNGYILTLGDRRIYIAGDTACTDEMKALTDIDVAFVPMNLPYTMPPEEAAECVRAFKPKIVYPYHYRGSDLSVFTAALQDVPEVEIRVREWYP